jgi:monofunctional biosynthetic peptidoglycan transglycosylase
MATARARSRPRGRIYRVLRLLFIVLLVLVLLPYLIAPVYRFVNPVSTVMLWRWANGARVERSFVPLDRMADVLPRSVVSAEDGNYCRHRGIDWQGLREAISESRGGSTITQQVAKNLFLWPGRSYVRKALELPLALWVNLVLPKRRVLEIYLNVVEWGPSGQFGAEAAARHAFGKSVREIAAGEAALLAAILPNPHRRSARKPTSRVRKLAGVHEVRTVQFRERTACIGTAVGPAAPNP